MPETPKYWTDFVNKHQLNGASFEIPEDHDISEMGSSFTLMNIDQITNEMNDYYPGIVVKRDSFVPVGSCNAGSGDPYFINSEDGPNGKLYRVYHDSVNDEGYDADLAIDIVLNNYEEMLDYKE
jgi:hypothetical protein